MIKIFKTAFIILAFTTISNARRTKPPTVNNANTPLLSGTKSATRGEFPWLVSFVASTVLFCSGSLIDASWVLTAAQCVTMPAYSYSVTFGGTDTAVGEAERLIMQSLIGIVHPHFNDATLDNDIALLKLQTPVTYSNYVKPIRLPQASAASNLFVGTQAIVSGWTYTINNRKKVIGNTLRFVNTAIISNAECQAKLPSQKISRDTMCSFLSGRTPCIGDVGGSIVSTERDNEPTQIGVTSYVDPTCPLDATTTYTKVASFLPWIYTITGVSIRA